jgi:hypothetical protein
MGCFNSTSRQTFTTRDGTRVTTTSRTSRRQVTNSTNPRSRNTGPPVSIELGSLPRVPTADEFLQSVPNIFRDATGDMRGSVGEVFTVETIGHTSAPAVSYTSVHPLDRQHGQAVIRTYRRRNFPRLTRPARRTPAQATENVRRPPAGNVDNQSADGTTRTPRSSSQERAGGSSGSSFVRTVRNGNDVNTTVRTVGSGIIVNTGNIVTRNGQRLSEPGNHSFSPTTYYNPHTVGGSSMFGATASSSGFPGPNSHDGDSPDSWTQHGPSGVQPDEGDFLEFKGASMSDWILNGKNQIVGRPNEPFQVGNLIHIFNTSHATALGDVFCGDAVRVEKQSSLAIAKGLFNGGLVGFSDRSHLKVETASLGGALTLKGKSTTEIKGDLTTAEFLELSGGSRVDAARVIIGGYMQLIGGSQLGTTSSEVMTVANLNLRGGSSATFKGEGLMKVGGRITLTSNCHLGLSKKTIEVQPGFIGEARGTSIITVKRGTQWHGWSFRGTAGFAYAD